VRDFIRIMTVYINYLCSAIKQLHIQRGLDENQSTLNRPESTRPGMFFTAVGTTPLLDVRRMSFE